MLVGKVRMPSSVRGSRCVSDSCYRFPCRYRIRCAISSLPLIHRRGFVCPYGIVRSTRELMDVTLSEEGADCGGSESDAYEELNRREFNSGVIDDECCKLEDLA
ncbi:hypothetical protein AHAS_Ahas10G0066200 [Arachis hypogaea]